MTTEAKVGAFTVVGVVLFVAVAMLLSGVSLSGHKGYTLYAGFKQVIGVEPQSVVRLSGVPVGKVKSIRNDGGGVTVSLDIDGNAKIPKGSAVTVASIARRLDLSILECLPHGAAGLLPVGTVTELTRSKVRSKVRKRKLQVFFQDDVHPVGLK